MRTCDGMTAPEPAEVPATNLKHIAEMAAVVYMCLFCLRPDSAHGVPAYHFWSYRGMTRVKSRVRSYEKHKIGAAGGRWVACPRS